jgi:hypothetical protein
MQALVLTFDNNQHVAAHAIACYDRLFSGNPFSFRVPYQSATLIQRDGQLDYVRSPAALVATVRTLLADLSADEWVFWCMDDYFPLNLDLPWLQAMIPQLTSPEFDDVTGINFCCSYKYKRYWRNRKLRSGDFVTIAGERFVESPDYDQIWAPQFIRVRALQSFFHRLKEPREYAKELDEQMRKLVKPAEHILLISASDHAIFAESTVRGRYSSDFVQSAAKLGISLDENRYDKSSLRQKRIGCMGLRDRFEKAFKR